MLDPNSQPNPVWEKLCSEADDRAWEELCAETEALEAESWESFEEGKVD